MVEPSLGLRVVRGPDWEWGDQDGGEGFVGTVTGLEGGGGGVVVQWDMGQRCRYRCGRDNKFDLRVLDSGPSRNLKGLKDISLILCDWCGEESLVGCVWRCVHCLDYYLCNHCYHNDRHSTRHPFFRIDVKNRVRLCSRHESRKVTLSGIFPESHVVRGTDWRWGNQDGGPGTVGKVTTIKGWQTESLRSVAVVQWGEKMTSNVYRLGHRGKVDLKCVEPTTGGSCYPDHLPVIGLYYVDKVGAIPSSELQLSAGDVVKVDLDIEVLKLMQADHGGWNDSMATIRGCAGVINYIHCDGDPEVRYNVGQIYKFNIDAVSKVDDVEVYFIGDVVRVNEDMNLVHSLQTEGPGWVDDLALTLGQVGIVTKLTVMTCVQVRVNGKRWVYDPRCLTRVSPDLLPENNDVEDVDMNARSQMLATMQSVSKEDLLVMAAGAGDATTVRQCLRQHPEQVNRMVDGRTALHEACKEGYPAVVEVLLEYSPDMECMDCNGIRPVQSCAYSNSGKTMSLLLQCGADVNSKGANESSALMVAATLGHNTVLSVMLAHPFLNIQAGGPIGNTALQCATAARRSETVRLLLEAGADPSIADYTASTPLHQAVGMGHFQIVEKMLMYYPDYINLKKDDDGYSLIHVAAANSQLEMLSLLLQQRSCEINSRASADLTALHIAAHEGHTALIELLVGYGADLNATVEKGNTALHLILAKQSMKPLDENTPYTLEVAGKLRTVFGERHFAPYTIVICMLLLEGADLYHKDSMGDSPLVLCPPEITDVLRNVVELCGRGKYHGSLRKSSVTLPKLNKKTATVVAASGAGDVGHKKFPSKELEKSPKRESEMSPPPKRESEMSPLPDDYENKSQTQDKERDLKALVKQPESGSTPTEEASGEDRLCCMCDKEFDVRLQPCGHTVLCLDCSAMAKRCPTCNVPITSREPLS